MKMFFKKKMIKTSTLLKATNRFSFDAPPAINCISSIQTSSIFEQTGLLMSRLTGNAAKISMRYYDRKIFGWIQVFQLLQSKLPFRISFTEFFISNTLPPNMSPATL